MLIGFKIKLSMISSCHVNVSSCALFEVPGIILTLQQQSLTIYNTLDGE